MQQMLKVLKSWSYLQNIEDSNLKFILNYKNHPIIFTIQTKNKGNNICSFIEEAKDIKNKFWV